jgi:hypothetical protein
MIRRLVTNELEGLWKEAVLDLNGGAIQAFARNVIVNVRIVRAAVEIRTAHLNMLLLQQHLAVRPVTPFVPRFGNQLFGIISDTSFSFGCHGDDAE